MYNEISPSRQEYLRKTRLNKITIRTSQFAVLFATIFLWEITARIGLIDSFIMSQPSRILRTVANFQNNNLLWHIGVTFMETIIGFAAGAMLGIFIAFLLSR